jgi:Domain of unknown function (DUF4386)
MRDCTVETSPQLYARIRGVLYLIIIIVVPFGEAFIRDRLIVSGDAAATAANIRSVESVWLPYRCRTVIADLPATLLPAFIGEASLCLWLLVKGMT